MDADTLNMDDKCSMSRRNFLNAGLLGYASFLTGCSAPKSQPYKMAIPEISASVFPQDIADEGISRVFDNLQNLASVNSAYLCNLNQTRRPFRGGDYPHNPVRKSYTPEPSRIYWKPDLKRYKRIKPPLSERDFLAGTDWVDLFVKECRRRGMKAGVEFFHNLIDYNRINGDLKELRQVDVWNRPIESHCHGKPAPCLNNPDFQDYVLALYTDVISNYDVDYVQTCMMPFVLPAHYLMQHTFQDPLKWLLIGPQKGGCFCKHCVNAAEREGFNLRDAQKQLQVLAQQDNDSILKSGITGQEYQAKHPILKRWFDFRCRSVNSLFSKIKTESKKCNPNIDIRWNNYIKTHGYYSGVHIPDFIQYVDSIRACVYVEHRRDPEVIPVKLNYLRWFNSVIDGRVHWLAALDMRGKNLEILEKCAELCSHTGCDGYSLAHYGEAPLENLKVVNNGLRKSKWSKLLF